MDLEEHNLTNFDLAVHELLDVSRKIMRAHESRHLNLKSNPILTQMEKYARIYSKSYPKEHLVYFENIFARYKGHILIGPHRDGWISDDSVPVRITFGEASGVNTNISWYLTSIYNTAQKMAQEIEEENKGLPIKAPEEIKLPRQFLLAFYRIFLGLPGSSFPTDFTGKLKEGVSALEKQLGVRSMNTDDSLGGIFDMVSPLVEQFTGQKMDKNNIPKMDQFQSLISNVMENPQAKTMVNNLTQNFKGANNIQELAGKFLGSLGSMSANAAGGSTTANPDSLLTLASSSGPSVNDEFED